MNPNIPNRYENQKNEQEGSEKSNSFNPNEFDKAEQSKNLELSAQQRKNLSQPLQDITQIDPSQSAPSTQVDDPVKQVKSMISAGYTPSIALIQSVQDLIKNKKTDWSDTWFAILLQKLLRELQN